MKTRSGYLIPATFFTITAMCVTAVGALDRGGTAVDKGLLVAISLGMIAGVHFLPAISRRPLSWVLWTGCLSYAIYGHLSFIANANLRAGEIRAKNTSQAVSTARQVDAVRSALAGITARPLSVVENELESASDWRKRAALKVERAEAKRAELLQDQLVGLTAAATEVAVKGASDPVAGRIAAVTGTTEENVTLLISLTPCILLELVGAFLWYQVFERNESIPQANTSTSAYLQMLADVQGEVTAERLKPTVQAIRKFLHCGQATAMQIRRDLELRNTAG